MKRTIRSLTLALFALASLGAAPVIHCSRITTVRFERMRADRDVKLVVFYDGSVAELPLHGRPAEFVYCSASFLLTNDDESKRVTVTINPDNYLVDEFGTVHVIVRVADLDH